MTGKIKPRMMLFNRIKPFEECSIAHGVLWNGLWPYPSMHIFGATLHPQECLKIPENQVIHGCCIQKGQLRLSHSPEVGAQGDTSLRSTMLEKRGRKDRAQNVMGFHFRYEHAKTIQRVAHLLAIKPHHHAGNRRVNVCSSQRMSMRGPSSRSSGPWHGPGQLNTASTGRAAAVSHIDRRSSPHGQWALFSEEATTSPNRSVPAPQIKKRQQYLETSLPDLFPTSDLTPIKDP